MSELYRSKQYSILIILTGLILSGINLKHLTIETTLSSTILGGVLPLITSLGIVAVGMWVYSGGWGSDKVTLLTGWFALGIIWMLIVGIGVTLYEYSEGVLPPDMWYLFAMYASYGSIPAFLTGLYDIQRRERKQSLEQSNTKLRQTLDFLQQIEGIANIGGWEIGPDKYTIKWTEGGLHVHGFQDDSPRTIEEVLEYYDITDQERIETAIDHCHEEGIPFELEVEMQTFQGQQRWVLIRGERAQKNGDIVIRGAIQNITQQRERQQRLTVLTRVLRHNIRNELNVIRGNAELLARDLEKLSELSVIEPESQSLRDALHRVVESTDEISANIDRIQRMVDHLEEIEVDTLVSRTETIDQTSREVINLAEKTRRFEEAIDKDFIIESVNVSSVLRELTDRYERQYPGVAIDLDPTDAEVVGNETAIKIIFEEVIDNAIKHQLVEDPTVSITVSERKYSTTVSVADTGPGIPGMEREVLSKGTETPLMHGSGLGLWIVNWLTTRLQGDVTIRETTPQGTIVNIHFRKPTEPDQSK